jgi:hypothetical protein
MNENTLILRSSWQSLSGTCMTITRAETPCFTVTQVFVFSFTDYTSKADRLRLGINPHLCEKNPYRKALVILFRSNPPPDTNARLATTPNLRWWPPRQDGYPNSISLKVLRGMEQTGQENIVNKKESS